MPSSPRYLPTETIFLINSQTFLSLSLKYSSTVPHLTQATTTNTFFFPPQDLAVHAVSPNATHADGTQEYDVHNLFGHQILNATYHALLALSPTKRPFIIGRSTFAGSGTVAGHWGGDNYSLWAYMAFSIPQALSFSLFGIPMFGVDTCGFAGNSDEELCGRWMQLSAFFPFYRNHNTLSANSQEAYVWASVAEATRTAMAIRFNLLPYMYTLFYRANLVGETVMRALAWEVPADPSLSAADRQFFLGPAILVTPVLEQGATSVQGVFPGSGGAGGGEVYYDWYTHEVVEATAGENVTIPAPVGHIPVFVRGGHMIAMQEAKMTTREARASSWSLLVALGLEGTASGAVYVDDGESVVPDATLYVEVSFFMSKVTHVKSIPYHRESHARTCLSMFDALVVLTCVCTVLRLVLLRPRHRPRKLRRHQSARQRHRLGLAERAGRWHRLAQRQCRAGRQRGVRCEHEGAERDGSAELDGPGGLGGGLGAEFLMGGCVYT